MEGPDAAAGVPRKVRKGPFVPSCRPSDTAWNIRYENRPPTRQKQDRTFQAAQSRPQLGTNGTKPDVRQSENKTKCSNLRNRTHSLERTVQHHEPTPAGTRTDRPPHPENKPNVPSCRPSDAAWNVRYENRPQTRPKLDQTFQAAQSRPQLGTFGPVHVRIHRLTLTMHPAESKARGPAGLVRDYSTCCRKSRKRGSFGSVMISGPPFSTTTPPSMNTT